MKIEPQGQVSSQLPGLVLRGESAVLRQNPSLPEGGVSAHCLTHPGFKS